jgi:formamidase
LRRFGYDDYQIYLLLSCAPVQGHIAGIVDVSCASGPRTGSKLKQSAQIPNACTTMGVPMDVSCHQPWYSRSSSLTIHLG